MKNIFCLFKLGIYEPDYAFLVLSSRIRNLFNSKIVRLRKISLLLTYRCNLSCSMCALGRNKVNKKNNQFSSLELTLQDVKEIIDFARISNSGIWLTGGEPLLNSKWADIAKYIKEKKLRCYLQTNGILLQEYKKEIIDYIDFLNVSLDGAPAQHNFIRGEKDVFEKVFAGIEEIDRKKKYFRKKKPYINICYTVTGENYKFLKNLIKILQESDIEINSFNFQHLEFINEEIFKKYRERIERENNQVPLLNIFLTGSSGIDFEELIGEIKCLKKSKLKFNVSFSPDISYEEIKRYYKEPHTFPKRVFRKCTKPYEEIFVHPQGDIWSCPGKVYGNFKKEKFLEILKRIRREAKMKNYEVCSECLGELYMYYRIVLNLLGGKDGISNSSNNI